jgi:hypothetical protein
MLLAPLIALAAHAEPAVREAHTVQVGAGALPACHAERGVAPCKAIVSTRAHGDHRLGRRLLLAWDLVGVRRSWFDDHGEVGASWRLDAAIGLGAHWAWTWGDMRLWAGPGVEHTLVEHGDPRGLPWLDAGRGPGRVPATADLGLVVGNDLDWPIGPIRLGGKWRYRIGAEVAPTDPAARAITKGVDLWELHALGLTWPRTTPVGLLAEAGWTTEITIPLHDPRVRVAPWLQIGLELRAGRTRSR